MNIVNRIRNKLFRIILSLGLNATIYSEENLKCFFSGYKDKSSELKSLDLGSGPNPRNPFEAKEILGVDIRSHELKNVVYGNIVSGSLPFETGSFDYVTAYDVLEHIPRVITLNSGEQSFPLILLMNEVFRVLKPGGVFFNIQPCYPMKEAFQDPTHVNIMTEDTMNFYFCERAWARIYGYDGTFTMLKDGWVGNKYFSYMKKSHDQPITNLNFIQR